MKNNNLWVGQSKISIIFGDKKFISLMWKLFLPAACQSLITIAISYVDNFFIAQFAENGTIAKTALGVCGPILMFTQILIMGALSGVGIMTAQYYGSNDYSKARQTIWIKIIFVLIMGIGCTAIIMSIPNELISIISFPDRSTPSGAMEYEYAVQYLYWSGLSIIPLLLNFALSFSFRETCQPKFALFAAIAAMFVNVILDPILIIFAQNDLDAIKNIAIATTISRVIQVLFLFIVMVWRKNNILFFFFEWRVKIKVFNKVIKNGWQIFINSLFYGVCDTFLIVCMYHYNPSIQDATTTVSLIIQYTSIIWPALAAGCTVLVGAELGGNRLNAAYLNSKRLMVWGLILSFFVSLTLLGLSFFINPILSPQASNEILLLTQQMEWVMIPMIISQGIFSMAYFSLQAGGSKLVFFTDGLISIVWSILMAVLTFTNFKNNLNPLSFMTILETNQLVKMIIAILIYRKGTWVQNLTRGN